MRPNQSRRAGRAAHRSGLRTGRSPAGRMPAVLLVLVVVLKVVASSRLERNAPLATPAPARPVADERTTATAAPSVADQQAPASAAVPLATAALAVSPPAPALPTCRAACLVRLPDPGGTLTAALGVRGLIPAYTAGGWLWASAPVPLVDSLRAEGTEVVVLSATADTVQLYAVRLPVTGGDASLIGEIGSVVDRVGNEFIVAATAAPPVVDGLIASGIAIEKIPPPVAPRAAPRQGPPLTRAVPFLSALSSDAVQATILDLQQAGEPDGDERSRYYTSDGSVTAAAYLYGRLADYGLTVWYEDFVADTGMLALNVVGELPGRDPSKTYLVVAHYDSVADGAPAPGADDNASGVAAMLEIARILSGYELAYPVRFAALAAEEAGLQGAKAFATRAATEQKAYAGAFNLDALGNPGRDHELIINGDAESAWLLDLLATVNADYGVGQDLLLRQTPAIVADDTILREYNDIPAVLITRAVVGDNPLHHTSDDLLAGTNVDGIVEAAYLTLLALADLLSPP